MDWSRRVVRWLPEAVRPLASVLYHTVHPGRSPAKFRWRPGRDPIAEVAHHLGVDEPVVVDGGAHLGQSVAAFQEHFRDPEIHSFEPVPEHVDELRSRYGSDGSVQVYPMALGCEVADVEFVVNHKTATSSVRSIERPYRLAEFTEDEAAYTPRETITVGQTRLDAALSSGVDVLKLDLQGFELEALRGCGTLLDDCSAVIAEVAFVRYYRGQPLFHDVDRFLRERGFTFYNLFDEEREIDGRLGVADAVYFDDGVLG